jgi:hypothetical protein
MGKKKPNKLIWKLQFSTFCLTGLACFASIGLGRIQEDQQAIASQLTEEWIDDVLNSPPPKADTTPRADDSSSDFPDDGTTIKATSTAAKLFATKKSPGAIAVGVAEGNYTLSGKARGIYFGHTDPGNHVTNRGFCSWNKASNISVAQADANCLDALQRQSAGTERRLKGQGIDPRSNVEALINGTDIWNQSNSAGPKFASKYKLALDKGIAGKKAILWARVEAFRNNAGRLDASGLFGICRSQPAYTSKLRGLERGSEAWQWKCISLDQGRRVVEVSRALSASKASGKL